MPRREGASSGSGFSINSFTSIKLGSTSLPDTTLQVGVEDAATNTVLRPFKLTRTSSNTPASSIGVGMEFEVEDFSRRN